MNVETVLKFSKASFSSVSNAWSSIVGILNKQPRSTPNLSPSKDQALKQLIANKDINILPANKGWPTVVMNRKDNDDKVLTMLNDTAVYRRLSESHPQLRKADEQYFLETPQNGSNSRKTMAKSSEFRRTNFLGYMGFLKFINLLCLSVPLCLLSLFQCFSCPSISYSFSVHWSEKYCQQWEPLRILQTSSPSSSPSPISTSVYWKKTHMDQYLQFSSYHRLAHEQVVIRTLFTRKSRLSSFLVHRSAEERYVVKTLIENQYPSHLIRRHHALGRQKHDNAKKRLLG